MRKMGEWAGRSGLLYSYTALRTKFVMIAAVCQLVRELYAVVAYQANKHKAPSIRISSGLSCREFKLKRERRTGPSLSSYGAPVLRRIALALIWYTINA